MNRAVGLVIARGWMNICGFAGFILVGRFLTDVDFGFFALASSVVNLPILLAGAGYSEHVISRDFEGHDEATAYWSALAVGLLGSLVVLSIAVVVQVAFQSPMSTFLYWFSILPTLCSFSVIREATLIRDRRSERVVWVLFSAETLGFIALFVALSMQLGIYALIASRLINALVVLGGYAVFARVRTSGFNIGKAIEIGRYSLGMMGGRILSWIEGAGGDFAAGAVLSAGAVGQFRMGGRLIQAAMSVAIQAPNPAQMAYLGERLRQGREALSRSAVRASVLSLVMIAPIFVSLTVWADEIFALLLPPRWAGAQVVMALFATSVLAMPGIYTANNLFAVTGRSADFFRFRVVMTAVLLVLFTISLFWGFWAAVVTRAGLYALDFVVSVFMAREISPQARTRLFSDTARVWIAAGCMAAAMVALELLIGGGNGDVWRILLRCTATGLMGVIAYGVAIRMFAPNALRLTQLLLRKLEAKLPQRFRPAVAAIGKLTAT